MRDEGYSGDIVDKLTGILKELQLVLAGRSNFLDSLLPPLFFVLINAIWSLQVAVWASLGLAAAIAIYRLSKGQSVFYALAGAGGVALSAAIAHLLGRAEGFFLPTIVWGAITTFLCLVSILVGRPQRRGIQVRGRAALGRTTAGLLARTGS
jgi:hypothetical protein